MDKVILIHERDKLAEENQKLREAYEVLKEFVGQQAIGADLLRRAGVNLESFTIEADQALKKAEEILDAYNELTSKK